MIKCFTFENFKSFEKAELNLEALTTLIGTNSSGKSNAIEGIAILAKSATGIELNTILDGTKSTGAVVRGGSRGCARFKTNAFKLGCLIDLDDTNDLLYEIKIGVGDRVGIEEEGLYLVKRDTFGPKTSKIFKTKKAEDGRAEIKVQYKNGMRGNDPDTICIRSSAILPQMVVKMRRDTEEEKTIISYMDRVVSHLKNIRMLDPVPSVIRDYVRTSDVELRQNCDNLSAVLYEMCKDTLKKDRLLEVVRGLPENDVEDIEFIETLKQKRNACDYSQSRLAQELQISRQNLNEIENGKTKASKEMKHILLHYLDYCNCTQPFTLTIDYLRVRFPTTDALEIIKNVLAMKSEYFIHEDYGMFGYEEQYIYGDISVNASKDSSMGVLLELRGMGCRNLEYVLQARGIDWYYFLSSCIDYQGVFKRIDLAVNDMGGLLDIEILRERYYANKVWKRSRTHEAVDSGKLSGTHGDTAKTFYIGSKNSSIYFCLYEKEKEQKSKGIKTNIKNRFEIRLKNGKAEQTIEQLVFTRNPEQTIASLILTQIDFPDYILWDIFLDNVTTSLPFIMTPVAVNMEKTKRWLERQVMPSLLMIKEIEKQTGANYLEEIDRHTRLTEKQELKIKQMTTDIADMIEKDTAVPQGNDGIF